MKISVIGGTGYVGLVTGAGFAAHQHEVVCADIDERKIEGLNQGILPIYEEGLEELVLKARQEKKISFTSDIGKAVAEADVIFVAVGTPEGRNGETDVSHLFRAFKSIAEHIQGYKIIAVKSTVPVGTCSKARLFIQSNMKNPHGEFDVVSNPEFLREGSAVKDFLQPERVVVGTDKDKSALVMEKLYAPFGAPVIFTDTRSSELIKYACNSYLATRLSFINEIAEICEKVDADMASVLMGMKLDRRIGGAYLNPGPGFGGPCLSKDIKALIHIGKRANADTSLLRSVVHRNHLQVKGIFGKIWSALSGREDRKVAILGLSFKAGTGDTRNSPAVKLVEKLAETKTKIVVYDPVVKYLEGALQCGVEFADTAQQAVKGADCMVLMTEWEEFAQLDLNSTYRAMRTPVIIDTRNLLPAKKAEALGFDYSGIGRRSSRHREAEELQRNIV